MKLDPKALEQAHEAYCTFGQRGGLRAQRLRAGILESTITAYLTAIGETHVLVPREPTEEMYRAGEEQVGCHQIYTAMLAAVKEGE